MKKNNAKRTVVVIALIALMAIPSMFAYFTGFDTATNEFTVGNVEIDLTEPAWDNNTDDVIEETSGEYDAQNVVAGDVIAKDPRVENKGASDAYVFIKVIEDENNATYTINYNNTNWTKLEDGVYYYHEDENNYLPAGKSVKEALFDTVTFDKATADDKAETFNVVVEAYAIQYEGFETPALAWAEAQSAKTI